MFSDVSDNQMFIVNCLIWFSVNQSSQQVRTEMMEDDEFEDEEDEEEYDE